MNMIEFEPRTQSDDEWKVVKDFRKIDHAKTYSIINNMLSNVEKLLPGEFKGKLEVTDDVSEYLAEKGSYYENLHINMKAGEFEQDINLKYPKLMKDNYFIMNGSMYIPILFLERSPIDILPDEKKGDKIFINLLPTFNITLNITKNEIMIRRKAMDFNAFLKGILVNEPEVFNEYVKEGIIPACDTSDEIIKRDMIKLLGIHGGDYFNYNPITIAQLFNKYIILDYFKGMFQDMFGIETIQEIMKLVITYHKDKVEINMSDIRNRRIVSNEYLINPVYEMYLRLLFGAIDKNEKQAFLPTMNNRVIITSGFQKLLHGGVYFNTSLPYTSPIINKVSQDIYIISEGRIPKSWSANHPSGLGKLCPISVSAQKMGSALIFTNDTRINYYGRVEQ